MNTARLVFGWLFLAGFTAAGTYYAMDEMDQRVGLARFQLHEKLGVTRYAAARQAINNQAPPINNQVPPINNQTPPVNNQTPPINNQTPPINNQNPPINNQNPPIYQTPPTNNQTPPINNQNPPVYQTPPTNNQTPPTNNQNPPVYRTPPTNNQTPPINNQTPPINNQVPPFNQGPGTQQRQRMPVDTSTTERLIEVKSRASALKKTWDTRKPAYGSLRPEIQTALSAMMRYTREAEAAAQSGDANAARHLMDQAEKQMEILQKFDE